MELTSTNSPCVLFLEKTFHPCFNKIYQISLVAIEERVHPTPFRTRKLSSPSPMILHNVMWESRPLPKIVRRPPCSSQREGVFFVLFLLWGATACYERFLALHVILIVPGTSRGFFVLVEKLAGRETFLEKGSPSPCPPFQKLLPVGLCKDGKSAAWRDD